MADDDGLSVRTPTKSEMNTFKVLANLDFADLRRAEPSSEAWTGQKDSTKDLKDMAKDPRRDTTRDPRGDRQDAKSEKSETWMASSLPPTPKLNAARPARADAGRTEDDDTESDGSYERGRGDRRRKDHDEDDDESESSYERGHRRYDQRDSRVERTGLKGGVSGAGPSDHHHDRDNGGQDRGQDRDERPVPEPKRPELEADVVLEKEALLYEIEMMEKQGQIKLHRELTMADSLDVIQYQYDRANMIVSTQQTVDWAKSGIKIGSNLLEMLMKKFGLTIVDGFSNNLCKDMSKFNKPLTKMYRKYWRRGTSSPESELAMIVFGALAVTVMANKGLTGSPPKPAPAPAPLGGAFGKESAMPSAMPSGMPSTMPSMNSMPTMKAAPAPPPIPEWAKAAMASPLPTHFAKDSFTELGPERAPVMPVSALRSIEPVRTDKPADKPVQERMERPIEKLERPIEKVERPIEKPDRPSEKPDRPIDRPIDRPTDRPIDRPDRPIRYEDDPVMSSSAPISSSVTSSSVVIDNTRKLTLSSPRSSRRKREMQSELNLDA